MGESMDGHKTIDQTRLGGELRPPTYYVLKCQSPLESEHYLLEVEGPANDKRWEEGILFSAADERRGFHPPPEPIVLTTEEDTEEPPRIYAELYWNPIPLFSRRLVEGLRAAGVDNLQTFETTLVAPFGENPPPANHYLAVNIVGTVSAADFKKSEFNPDVRERTISADFYSLSVDASKARDFLMFRLLENITAVLVHERVKEQVEAAGIRSLTWIPPHQWAG
jgi:uncharacterized protein DUF1629